jgi:Holliday junction DNA helicase RuvA
MGVSYEIRTPMPPPNDPAANFATPGELVTVYIYHYFGKDGAQSLFGFRTEEEKTLFKLLIDKVSGVGPAAALAVIGGMPARDFKAATVAGDWAALSKIKGLGAKTAQKIVVDLKDKLAKMGMVDTWEGQVAGTISAAASDAEMALKALGYKDKDAKEAVKQATAELGKDATADELIRKGLGLLNRR